MELRLLLAFMLLVMFGGAGLLTTQLSGAVRVASVSEPPDLLPTVDAVPPISRTPTASPAAAVGGTAVTPSSTAPAPLPVTPASGPTIPTPPPANPSLGPPSSTPSPPPARRLSLNPAELMETLAGFSGKSNQQRQAYVAERLFVDAGLTDILLQQVWYGGTWGEESGTGTVYTT